MNGQSQRAPHGAASLSRFPPVKQEDAPAYTPLNAYGAYAPFQGVQFSDLELAESLGWPAQGATYGQGYEGEYRLAQGTAATAAVSAMSAHEGSRHGQGQAQGATSSSHSAPTHAASGAHGVAQSFPPTGTSYNTMPIPHAASPAWSGLESPSFLAEPSPLSREVSTVKPLGGKDKGALSDRKAMRRYSHNAVERRRRDNINESIHELSLLVPATLLGCAAPSSPPPQQASPAAGSMTATATASAAAAAAAKPNKGVVLRKSIEYIHMLKAEVERRNERARVLEAEIERLGGIVPVEQIQVAESPLSLWQDESAITEDES